MPEYQHANIYKKIPDEKSSVESDWYVTKIKGCTVNRKSSRTLCFHSYLSN